MNKRLISSTLKTAALVCAAAVLFSCQMTQPYQVSEGPVMQTAEASDIFVECTFLDQKTIEARHGFSDNPFLSPPLIITPQRMIVFELKITNNDSAPLRLDIRDISFYYNDMRYSPMSTVQMEQKIDNFSESRTTVRENRVARSYMLPNVTHIEGNSKETGYIVFMDSFRDRGDGELILGFTTEGRNPVAEVNFNYSFIMK